MSTHLEWVTNSSLVNPHLLVSAFGLSLRDSRALLSRRCEGTGRPAAETRPKGKWPASTATAAKCLAANNRPLPNGITEPPIPRGRYHSDRSGHSEWLSRCGAGWHGFGSGPCYMLAWARLVVGNVLRQIGQLDKGIWQRRAVSRDVEAIVRVPQLGLTSGKYKLGRALRPILGWQTPFRRVLVDRTRKLAR
jgi:hypothetical protein